MTQKQIEEAKKTLPRYNNGKRPKLTPKQQRLEEELDCRSMINSCLIYGMTFSFYNPQTKEFGQYAQIYREKLDDEVILRLLEEQKADFAKATVQSGVYTDSDECTYNSCSWGDE